MRDPVANLVTSDFACRCADGCLIWRKPLPDEWLKVITDGDDDVTERAPAAAAAV